MKIPSFIVTLAGMLVFKGLALCAAAAASSVGPFPPEFQLLSAGLHPGRHRTDDDRRRQRCIHDAR